MRILLSNTFKSTTKKLHNKQKMLVEKAIQKIQAEPSLGELKVGDLSGVRVFKFPIDHQTMLLAYMYDESCSCLTLLMLAPHENFYKNLKNTL